MRRIRWTPTGMLAASRAAWGALELEEKVLQDRGFELVGDAAVVEIDGPLLHRPQGFFALFCDSYEAIEQRVKAALESNAQRVILRINSPGGDASGCFELSRELRRVARAAGKKLIAFVDETACSAAYAIACAGDEVVLPETASVGSVGVYQVLVDATAQDRAMGLNVVVVASGERKTDGNPHVALTETAVAERQEQVDQLAQLFFELVAEMRPGVKVADVAALEGRTVMGSRALQVGLADRVAPWTAVVAPAAATETANMGDAKKSFDAAKEALRAVIDDEKASAEERDKARKSLKALEAEEKKPDGDGEEKKDPPVGARKADAEDGDGKKDEARKAEAEEKKEEARAVARASSSSAQASAEDLDLVKRVHTLEAERDARNLAEERGKLLAKRPDFSPQVRAKLEKAPLDYVRMAVEDWPVATGNGKPLSPAAAAASATGTRGAGHGAETDAVPGDEASFIDRKMGLRTEEPGVKAQGRTLELGYMGPEAAKKRLAELHKQQNGGV